MPNITVDQTDASGSSAPTVSQQRVQYHRCTMRTPRRRARTAWHVAAGSVRAKVAAAQPVRRAARRTARRRAAAARPRDHASSSSRTARAQGGCGGCWTSGARNRRRHTNAARSWRGLLALARAHLHTHSGRGIARRQHFRFCVECGTVAHSDVTLTGASAHMTCQCLHIHAHFTQLFAAQRAGPGTLQQIQMVDTHTYYYYTPPASQASACRLRRQWRWRHSDGRAATAKSPAAHAVRVVELLQPAGRGRARK